MKLIEVYDSYDDFGSLEKRIYINMDIIDKVTIHSSNDKSCNVYCKLFMETEREDEYLMAHEFDMNDAISFVTKNIGLAYDYHNADSIIKGG